MKCIGILGGSSDKATTEYYRLINEEVNRRLGGWNTGRMIIDSMNFDLAIRFTKEGLWEEAGDYLSQRAYALEGAGAELLICAANTLHRVADVFTSGLRIPFIHIVDPTAEAIQAAGLSTVALLGTKPSMSEDFLKRRYTERFGIKVLVPTAVEQDTVDRIIFDELCRGLFTEESKQRYLGIVDRLQLQGAQGVILGCTEIPLLVNQHDRPSIPMFNTVLLHAQAAVTAACD